MHEKPIPRIKMSKRQRKFLDSLGRRVWVISPVTRKVPSKRIYDRKRPSGVDGWSLSFCRSC